MKRFYQRLKIWFSYWKVTKNVYDFDYIGILEVERHQIKRTLDCISKYQSHQNADRDIFWMKTAISILDFILGYRDMPYYVNTRNYKRYVKDRFWIEEVFKYDVYNQKCWYLYNKIRKEHLLEWWD
jgi:hypothetical protein